MLPETKPLGNIPCTFQCSHGSSQRGNIGGEDSERVGAVEGPQGVAIVEGLEVI